MQRLDVSCAVRLIYKSLGAKGLRHDNDRVTKEHQFRQISDTNNYLFIPFP